MVEELRKWQDRCKLATIVDKRSFFSGWKSSGGTSLLNSAAMQTGQAKVRDYICKILCDCICKAGGISFAGPVGLHLQPDISWR